jgi:hypothetical protein
MEAKTAYIKLVGQGHKILHMTGSVHLIEWNHEPWTTNYEPRTTSSKLQANESCELWLKLTHVLRDTSYEFQDMIYVLQGTR